MKRTAPLSTRTSAPSEAAVQAAFEAQNILTAEQFHQSYGIREALAGAHDAALGLDRSVCLRDVVDALQRAGEGHGWMPDAFRLAAGLVDREFGQGR